MHYEDDTDDVICQAMGLGDFMPIRSLPMLRMLLKPSFHPELCINLEETKASAVGLRSMLWREPAAYSLPKLSESFPVTPGVLTNEVQSLSSILRNRGEKKWMTIDGISVSAIYHDGKGCILFNDHPYGAEERDFVSRMLSLAFSSSHSIPLRNHIADCGGYVGLDLAKGPEPTPPDVTRLLVVGDPQQREDYLEMLRHKLSDDKSC